MGESWLNVSALTAVSGTWSVSNDTPVSVIILYGTDSYTNSNSATQGSFNFSGPPPFEGEPGTGDWVNGWFVVISTYPVTITVQGSYASPLL
ncbi:MAG: hypothetical protein ACLPZM_05670 [Thermoplasmata archaeon]